MKKLVFILIAVMILGFCGCALTPFPQCNERFNQEAYLVMVANDMKVCLDDVGNSLILANGVAISVAKLYTAEQALKAVNDWIEVLRSPIIDTVFKDTVYASIGDFPELFILTDAFTLYFNTGDIIDQPSREILVSYLEKRVKPVLEKRLSLK